MKPNKIFFDLYSTSGGSMSKEEYGIFYNYHDTVYIALVDAGIYTKVKRQTMFDKNMHHGCFIEHFSYYTPAEVVTNAMNFVDKYELKYVDPDEFIAIEKENENARVNKALKEAEDIIRRK